MTDLLDLTTSSMNPASRVRLEQKTAVFKTTQMYQNCVAKYRKVCAEIKVLEKAQQLEDILNQLDTTNDPCILNRLLSNARATIRAYVKEETAKSDAEWQKSVAEWQEYLAKSASEFAALREQVAEQDAKRQVRLAKDEAKWRELASRTTQNRRKKRY